MELSPPAHSSWQDSNLAAILKRLNPLRAEPMGIIHQEVTAYHDIIIQKEGVRVNLIFDTDNPERFSIESRIDLNKPLKLLSTYTQIMILSLVWAPQPKRVYMIGLGGGRIPMVLHHYLPQVVVECTEIDPALPGIAERYFGVQFDERYKVFIQDGRQYLEERGPEVVYDIILVDAFFESLYTPYQFATQNFFELCQNRLSEAGVLMVNLIMSDPLFDAKIDTLREAFSQVYLCTYEDGDTVVLGTNAAALSHSQIKARAQALQARHRFSFPLLRRARQMKPYAQGYPKLPGSGSQHKILLDASPPDNLFEGLSRHHPLFRNLADDDLCPCLSGNKFKDCHQGKLSAFVE